jgi:thiamine-phosphate pyrophosphorylase
VNNAHTSLLETATLWAMRAHQGQTRRHGAPYIDHPRAVADLVADLIPLVSLDPDDLAEASCMALLHDVVEDSDVTTSQIADAFGERIAGGVTHLTKTDKSDVGVTAYFRALLDAPPPVRLVKICDRLHNLSELWLSPDVDKTRKSIQETLAWVLPLAPRTGLRRAVQNAVGLAARNQQLGGGETTLPSRGLYALVDGQSPDSIGAHVELLCRAGVVRVQLRQKSGGDREKVRLMRRVADVCRRFGVVAMMNDRVDLAVIAGADGVHVGDDDVTPSQARVVGVRPFRVGHTTHTLDELQAASLAGDADHIAIGPVFLSVTKAGHAAPIGIDTLSKAVSASSFPVVAIGGIDTLDRVIAVTKTGASFVAGVSLFAPSSEGALATHRFIRRCAIVIDAYGAA